MEVSRTRKNILVELIQRNGVVEDVIEFFGRVDTKKLRYRGCDGIFWSSRYKEMEVSRMQ